MPKILCARCQWVHNFPFELFKPASHRRYLSLTKPKHPGLL